MRRISVILGLLFFLGLTACARYQVVQIPLREADLYPLTHSVAGVTIAIDEMMDPARVEKYFGVDLIKGGILPINVIFSNHGNRRFNVRPSDVVLYKGKEAIDPLPIEVVVRTAKRRSMFLMGSTSRRVVQFFSGVTLKETILLPNETYQGILFFPASTEKEPQEGRYFTVLKLFGESSFKLQIALTDLGTKRRIHFGPFPLSR